MQFLFQIIIFHNKLRFTSTKPLFTYKSIQQITRWKYEWYIRNHVDHAGHIHCSAGDFVVVFYNISNDAVLYPLHGIARAVQNKYGKN